METDASYSFRYSGTAVHALAAAKSKKGGALSPKDEVALKAETANLLKDPQVRRADYKGDGRYELLVESKQKPGQQFRMLNIFTVSTDNDGVMTIASVEVKDKAKRELEALGIKVDGTLDVKLPKNAEVISHNATATPSFFGMFGTYSWKIGSVGQRPLLRVRLKVPV